FALDVKGDRACLNQGIFKTTGSVRQWCWQFVHDNRGIDTNVDDFHDAVFELVPEFFQVCSMERFFHISQPLVINFPFRNSKSDFISLSLVSGVSYPPYFPPAMLCICRIQSIYGLSFEVFV